jgi:hypothetical protein
MKDEKDLNSTKMDQRGKTPDRKKKKKNPTGGMDVCVVFTIIIIIYCDWVFTRWQ